MLLDKKSISRKSIVSRFIMSFIWSRDVFFSNVFAVEDLFLCNGIEDFLWVVKTKVGQGGLLM